MPSYIITGASRGLGYAFAKVLASEPANTVFSIVRNKAATEQRLAKDGIVRVQVFQADITDAAALRSAAAEIQKTCPAVDYLICNAADKTRGTTLRSLADFDKDLDVLKSDIEQSFQVNVIGLINTVHSFLPLVHASSIKKVIVLTSGLGALDFVNETGIDKTVPMAISKAAVNMVVAKYDAAYKNEGLLFMGICAGIVNTAEGPKPEMTEDDNARLQDMMGRVFGYAPHKTGAALPEEGAKQLLKVIYGASLEAGSGGRSVSYKGSTERWL